MTTVAPPAVPRCVGMRPTLSVQQVREDLMKTQTTSPVHVVGGGLAGSEAAWQLVRAGVPVVLHEMRPETMTEAH